MKQLKPLWLRGIVQLKVSGHYPERFFDLCAQNDIRVWSIKKQSQLECVGEIHLEDISSIRKLRRKTHYKLSFGKKYGLPFFYQKIIKQQPLVMSFLLASLFFIYLTQSIWFIAIEGVPAEMEVDIRSTLSDYGVKRGKLKALMDKPDQIQSQLLSDYPNLLWVGVEPNGVTYQLDVIIKNQPPELAENTRTHLYAKKDGVISEMFVEKGRPLVKVNDFVKKGQLLVTGELDPTEQEQEDDEITDFIPIEAEIFATTWYESEVIVPLEGIYQVETGLSKQKYYLEIGSFRIPIWGFGSSGFEKTQIESSRHSFSVANWRFPLMIARETHKEVESMKEERSKEEALGVGLTQARKNLKRKLDVTSSIVADKILHQSLENGKVKIHVYFTVNENIVNTTSSNQGD